MIQQHHQQPSELPTQSKTPAVPHSHYRENEPKHLLCSETHISKQALCGNWNLWQLPISVTHMDLGTVKEKRSQHFCLHRADGQIRYLSNSMHKFAFQSVKSNTFETTVTSHCIQKAHVDRDLSQ